ncbi:hypothetical protein KR067_002328, partial [Drosophila pandora]
MISKHSGGFADPNKKLPFNTNVVATIRTQDNEPLGAADFVNQELKDLLKNGIIRPSRSPYNNPIWVVDKRLVVDFRKLNLKTIADRYPMPSLNMIRSNLGRAKFCTTLNIKSGYHQIELAELDREKANQFILGKASTSNKRLFTVFATKTRHQIDFSDWEKLVDLVKDGVTPNVVNAIHCKFPVLARIQDSLVWLFPDTKFWYC